MSQRQIIYRRGNTNGHRTFKRAYKMPNLINSHENLKPQCDSTPIRLAKSQKNSHICADKVYNYMHYW